VDQVVLPVYSRLQRFKHGLSDRQTHRRT